MDRLIGCLIGYAVLARAGRQSWVANLVLAVYAFMNPSPEVPLFYPNFGGN